VGLFNTTNRDDILFQTTGRSTGLFANVDKTQRRGFEGKLIGSAGALNWMIAYSHLEATFEADFKALSPNHDFADDDGEITVSKGDSIPGHSRAAAKASRGLCAHPALAAWDRRSRQQRPNAARRRVESARPDSRLRSI
jgi:hypothetical protein